MRSKKGIAGSLVVLAIIVLSEIMFIGFGFVEDVIREKHHKQALHLYFGSKLDFYSKFLLNGLKLSLVQSLYDEGCKANRVVRYYGANWFNDIFLNWDEIPNWLGERILNYVNLVIEKTANDIGISWRNRDLKVIISNNRVKVQDGKIFLFLRKVNLSVDYTFKFQTTLDTLFKKLHENAGWFVGEDLINQSIEEALEWAKRKKIKDIKKIEDKIKEEIGKEIEELNSLLPIDFEYEIKEVKANIEGEKYYGAARVLIRVKEPSYHPTYVVYDSCRLKKPRVERLNFKLHIITGNKELIQPCKKDGYYCRGDIREERDYYVTSNTICSFDSDECDCPYNVLSTKNCNEYDEYQCKNNDIYQVKDGYCSDGECKTKSVDSLVEECGSLVCKSTNECGSCESGTTYGDVCCCEPANTCERVGGECTTYQTCHGLGGMCMDSNLCPSDKPCCCVPTQSEVIE